MSKQSYSKLELKRLIQKEDFKRHLLNNQNSAIFTQNISLIANTAHSIATREVFINSRIKTHIHKGKKIFILEDLPTALVMRKTAKNILNSFGVDHTPRNEIIQILAKFLKENTQFRIYKLDIENFFETIDSQKLFDHLNSNLNLSQKSVRLVTSFLNYLAINHSSTGVPRGVAISAALSEIALTKLTKYLNQNDEVYFFSRYVDDIIVVTSGLEIENQFIRDLTDAIEGLKFNSKKQKVSLIKGGGYAKASEIPFQFEYLGYDFLVPQQVQEREVPRNLQISIAENKMKKIKTRISRCLLSFKKTRDFNLLKDRIRALTSNYEFFDARRNRKIYSGIYYSYPEINDFSCLDNLDKYLTWALFKNNRQIIPWTSTEKRQLNAFSFSKGFKSKIVYYFSGKKLAKIQSCWKYA